MPEWRRGLSCLLLWAFTAYADELEPAPRALLQRTVVVDKLEQVTDFQFLPDGGILILEKEGAVRLRGQDGKLSLVMQLPVDSESEKGGLGLALHPDFSKNRTFFVYYSRADAAGGTDEDRHRVSAFILGAEGKGDPKSEKILVRGLRGPANHDGGALAVGPDGKLYIGVGDTGCNSGAGPGGRITNFFGTCLSNGNGKILRVGLDGSIPKDNPLVAQSRVTACGDSCRDSVSAEDTAVPRRDIWAWGFRNPWRFWFDPRTGKLWVGDVGEVTFEEVTIVKAGRHHGWPFREGAAGRSLAECDKATPGFGPCVDPIYMCRHGGSKDGIDGDCSSITAGAIVDSCRWPEPYRGRYVFADNANGNLWSIQVKPTRDAFVPGTREKLGHIGSGLPVTLRLGPDGDLYVAALPGSIQKISPVKPLSCAQPRE